MLPLQGRCSVKKPTASGPAVVFVFGMHARRIGGIEVHTREVAAQLAARGLRTVLCFERPPIPEVRAYLSLPNVSWDTLPDASRNSWQSATDLLRVLRRHRPGIVHFQFTPFLSLNAWIARLAGVRTIVVTDHTSDPECYSPRRASLAMRAVGRLLTSPVTAAVAVSDHRSETIVTLGTFSPQRLRRIYNGVDLERPDSAGPAFRALHNIPPERVLIVQVSQLRPEKGIPDVLGAARLAQLRHPGLHFAFVGDGTHLEEYKRLAAELGITNRVTWAGLVCDPVAEGVFAAADICCLASRWQEAFGFVIAEAMSSAKPVVGTSVGGIPELILHGETGLLVPRGDIAAMAGAFVQLACDSGLRLGLGLAGRDRAHQYFDVRKNVASLLDLYGISYPSIR